MILGFTIRLAKEKGQRQAKGLEIGLEFKRIVKVRGLGTWLNPLYLL
jgi:hypothetical protein